MAIKPTFEPPDDLSPLGRRPVREGDLESQKTADIIRQKVARIFADEPEMVEELAEVENAPKRSKHQQFMYDLGTSGKTLADIQTEWHDYYQNLSDEEKLQVWQEFYASQSAITGQHQPHNSDEADSHQALSKHKQQAARPKRTKPSSQANTRKLREIRSVKDVQAVIKHNVTAGGKLEAKHHFQSLLFGLGMGLIVVVIFLFGFFNEVIISPFIQPGRVSSDTPLIVSGSTSVASVSNPEVIIPKINVEIPVNYNESSTNESAIENDLQSGIVHYPTTSVPGQAGNAAFFGHSSNNIFNKGKYKFAFVLLHTLVPGDTFYLSYGGKMYVYKVITRNIVDPSNIGVLNAIPGQAATATLITCDPPGTSLHRLIVVGQQISPDPSGNTQTAPTTVNSAQPAALPGNGPTLWARFIKTFVGKTVVTLVVGVGGLLGARWINKRITDSVN